MAWVLATAGFAAVSGGVDRTVETVVPGLTLTHFRWGAPESGARWLVAVGKEKDQRLADALVARVERLGYPASQVASHDVYEVRAAGFRSEAAAEAARAKLVRAGLDDATVRAAGNDETSASGPFVAHVLELDPRSIEVVVAHGRDAAIGLETTRDLATRRGAIAAVNGGFYRMTGPFAGDSEGVLVLDGALVSEPDRGRAGVGFVEEHGAVRALFDRLSFCARVVRDEAGSGAPPPLALDGVDRARRDGEAILYTPAFHRTTLTAPGGVEVVARSGRVTEVREGPGSTAIPDDGFVVSFAPGHPDAHALAVGDAVAVESFLEPKTEVTVAPLPADPAWRDVRGALGAGPLLLSGGRLALRPEAERISGVFAATRHPRTAVAARADGSILLVAVDGRRPGVAVGMTLRELANFLLELGATDAVNLDGGGSTTMVVRGATVNAPTDESGDRANGDAILLFAR